jgi:drug/metabolite transporter (DMT)-like permease
VALRSWPPVLLGGTRSFLGGVIMTAFVWIPQRRRFTRDEWRSLGVTTGVGAVFNVALLSVAIIYCVAWTSGGLAALLTYTQPLFLTVLAWALLKEELTAGQLGLIFLGVGGVALVTLPSGGSHWSVAGVAIGIGAAVSWAVGSIWIRGRSLPVPLGGGTPVGSETAALVGGPQFILGGAVLLLIGTVDEGWGSIHATPESIAAALGFTVCGTIGWISYLYLLAHRDVQARRIGSWAFAVPLIANALGIVFLNETIDAVYVLGAIVIATSIFAVELTARNQPAVVDEPL